ncbi:class F sortase [Serinicoccus profundi]|uniref:class F sortase n=1 Tax=Serinicoccus profundi TaxID=1078471 RepID=UPI000255E35B|nr:class F sortase [Serinicoccus profundi]
MKISTVLAALAVVVGVVLLVLGLRQPPDPPSPAPSSAQSSEESAGSEDATPDEDAATEPGPPGPAGSDSAAQTQDAVPSAEGDAAPAEEEPEPVAALDPSEPVEVRIPSIEVTSPLHPLGLADDGTLMVPSGDRYDEAAWYDGSPTPGEIGPTVIEGHVTAAGGVPSIFFELGALTPGDTAEVEREDGKTVTYEIYRVDQFAKDEFPTVDVYGPTDGPELRLITCGGEFDEQEQSHEDNTVVYARMVEG